MFDASEIQGAGGVFSFRGLLVEVSLALVGVAPPAIKREYQRS